MSERSISNGDFLEGRSGQAASFLDAPEAKQFWE